MQRERRRHRAEARQHRRLPRLGKCRRVAAMSFQENGAACKGIHARINHRQRCGRAEDVMAIVHHTVGMAVWLCAVGFIGLLLILQTLSRF